MMKSSHQSKAKHPAPSCEKAGREVVKNDDVVLPTGVAVGLFGALFWRQHLRGSDAPTRRITQSCGEQFVSQLGHGPAEPPTFMIQCADDDPVDAGRVVGSPWHRGWVRVKTAEPSDPQFYITRKHELLRWVVASSNWARFWNSPELSCENSAGKHGLDLYNSANKNLYLGDARHMGHISSPDFFLVMAAKLPQPSETS